MTNIRKILLMLIFSSLLVTADTIEIQISHGDDDIEEHVANGEMEQGSSDLEMTQEHDEQLVGLRFKNITIPNGAIITNAYIQFTSDETDSEDANLLINGELNPNAPIFTNANGNLSSRAKTSSYVKWDAVDKWLTLHEKSKAQQSSDISSLIQEIVNQNRWQEGNSLALIISGEGKRVARSYEAKASDAPTLHIEFTSKGGVIKSQISHGDDDIEEHVVNGEMEQGSSDLEMTEEHDKQLVGLRFKNITIPNGAVVTNAYIQFTSDETDSKETNLLIHGELTPNTSTFTENSGDLSSRVTTYSSVDWSAVSSWLTLNEKSKSQQSSDIKSIVNEIIEQDGWESGNPMSFIISGEGERVAVSYEKNPKDAPILYIEYSDKKIDKEENKEEEKNKDEDVKNPISNSLVKLEIIKRDFKIPFFPERVDMEAMTYIPSDNAIWITNDDGRDATYRLNLETKEVDRYILGFKGVFDPKVKASDVEAIAYDELNDLLYIASSDKAIFKLTRIEDGNFEIIEAHNLSVPITSMVFVNHQLYVADNGTKLKKYNFDKKQFSKTLYISKHELFDMAYSDGILWVTTRDLKLEKIDWESKKILNSFDMVENGVKDPRGVVAIEDKLYISDGSDFVYGELRHAMHVFKIP